MGTEKKEVASQGQKAVKQYEIRWANLPLPAGRQPVLLLTRTSAYRYLSKAIVAEITTTIRHIPQEVSLGRPEGVRQPSVANFDSIHVVPLAMLGDSLGTLSSARSSDVKRAVGAAFGWAELLAL